MPVAQSGLSRSPRWFGLWTTMRCLSQDSTRQPLTKSCKNIPILGRLRKPSTPSRSWAACITNTASRLSAHDLICADYKGFKQCGGQLSRLTQSRDAHERGRVRVVERSVNGVRRECARVISVELHECGSQLARARVMGGERIGFEFMPSRPPRSDWCGEKGERLRDQSEENQRRVSRGYGHPE